MTVLAGVFEGGGAKGIAYEGALLAVEDAGLWFTAVAGASAGAITAALIGAGYTASEIAARSTEAMATLEEELALPTGRWKRLPFVWRRVCALAAPQTAAAGSSDGLEAWLRVQLADRAGVTDPTFADLYRSSGGIELTIVAVDIHHRQHRIFNHAWSPTVSVASAAVASSSIPFALPPRRLVVASDSEFAAPIVDGGVWTNFPLFVFEDPEFRTFHQLVPFDDLGATVVGFLLDEAADQISVEDVQPIRFVTVPDSLRDAAERARTGGDGAEVIGPSELLLTFDRQEVRDALEAGRRRRWLPQSGDDTILDGWLRASWEVPGMRAAKLPPDARRAKAEEQNAAARVAGRAVPKRALFTLVNLVRLLAMVAYTLVMVVAALAVAATPVWLLLRRVDHGVWWTHTLWWFGMLIAVVVGLSAGVVFLAITTGNAVLYWPMRRFGGLIMSTYVAGSGAPYWAGRAPDDGGHLIVRLPIPHDIRTTSFAVSATVRGEVVARARATTRDALDGRKWTGSAAGAGPPPTS